LCTENGYPEAEAKRKRSLISQASLGGGDSWTRTNDPIDVNDVLCLYGVFTSQPQDLVVVDKDFHHITQEMLGFFGGANCYQPQSMTKNIK